MRAQIRAACVDILVAGRQELTLSKLDLAHVRIALALRPLKAAAQSDDSNFGDVALKQSIGRLGGTVGNKHNILGLDAALIHNTMKGLHDTSGDPLRCLMRGRHLYRTHQLECLVVNCNRVCKCATHIDTNANLHNSS